MCKGLLRMWFWVSFKPFTLIDSKGALTSMPSRRTALGSATSTAYFRMVRGSRATPVACTHSMHVLSSNSHVFIPFHERLSAVALASSLPLCRAFCRSEPEAGPYAEGEAQSPADYACAECGCAGSMRWHRPALMRQVPEVQQDSGTRAGAGGRSWHLGRNVVHGEDELPLELQEVPGRLPKLDLQAPVRTAFSNLP